MHGETMLLEIDPDVKAAAEFMQAKFAATKLIPVAEALSALAPILWGRHGREVVTPLELVPNPSAVPSPEAANQ